MPWYNIYGTKRNGDGVLIAGVQAKNRAIADSFAKSYSVVKKNMAISSAEIYRDQVYKEKFWLNGKRFTL